MKIPGTRAGWRACVENAAPDAPAWLHSLVTRLLAAPNTRCDGLLILSDALIEARDAAAAFGYPALAAQLHTLADLPCALAFTRTDDAPDDFL